MTRADPGSGRRPGARAFLYLGVGLLALLQTTPARAQDLLIDPGAAHLRRDMRQLQQQLRTSPESVQGEINRVRRNLIRESRGVYFTPEQARINRGLNQLESEVARQRLEEEPPSPLVPPRGDDLPSSYGDDAPLPSMRRELTLTGRLLDRAEEGLAEGRVSQAASDLATARSFLGSTVAEDNPLAAEVGQLQARMQNLERRLAALP